MTTINYVRNVGAVVSLLPVGIASQALSARRPACVKPLSPLRAPTEPYLKPASPLRAPAVVSRIVV